MPSNDRIGPDNQQMPAPIAPESRQENPEEAIPILQLRPLSSPIADLELMPESEVLQEQRAVSLEPRKERA